MSAYQIVIFGLLTLGWLNFARQFRSFWKADPAGPSVPGRQLGIGYVRSAPCWIVTGGVFLLAAWVGPFAVHHGEPFRAIFLTAIGLVLIGCFIACSVWVLKKPLALVPPKLRDWKD
jgi:hypothetical protein